jgi:hypothetical protein
MKYKNRLKNISIIPVLILAGVLIMFSTGVNAKNAGRNTVEVTTKSQVQTTENPTTGKNQQETTVAVTTTGSQTPATGTGKIKASKLNPAKAKVILLDAGHCKKHIGARGHGLKEEKINLNIAKACKNYLDTYSDVTVHMTRTNNNCLKSLMLGDCLTARNHLAQRLGADFLVSFHVNYDPDPNRSGAMILAAYNSGYNSFVSTNTKAMGKEILNNLKLLGAKSEGFWLRKLKNTRYKNGAKADYYSIVREGVLNKIPSLIVEHGYISNENDCNNFFKTSAKRKALGVADAKGIVTYHNLTTPIIEGDFKKISNNIYFIDNEGNKITGWVKKDGKWYHFNSKTAKMENGFIKIDRGLFYLDTKTGEMKTGWFTVKNKRYLAKGNGTVVTNRIYSDGVRSYYFGKNGKRKDGWVKYKKAKYYFSKNKGMLKGKQRINGRKYVFSRKTGKLKKR